jgi:hypothetical protein
MGWNFGALMRYGGPTPEFLDTLLRLERDNACPPLQAVIDYGREQDFAFARPGKCNAAIWRSHPDYEPIEARPTLPCFGAQLELPSGFLLMFGADAVWAEHFVRWMFFLDDPRWQDVLLGGIRYFCSQFRASECIVTRNQHPTIAAFEDGASFADALRIGAKDNDGEVPLIKNLYIDLGYDENLAFEDADGNQTAVPVFDSRGYWRLI